MANYYGSLSYPVKCLARHKQKMAVVVIRTGDGKVFGLDARDGKRKWVYQRATPALTVRSNVGVLVTHGAVFAGFAGGKLVALNLTNVM